MFFQLNINNIEPRHTSLAKTPSTNETANLKSGLRRALDSDKPHFCFFNSGPFLFAISLHI